ncbi:MAG: regulatory protein RecX [Chromatiales bacterium]|jgi:regulatory protein
MPTAAALADLEQAAMRLLAVREHTVRQLRHKLLERDFEAGEVEQLLQDFQQRNLLSDARFAELCVNSRMRKGYGPTRIAMELRDKGVAENLIEMHAGLHEHDWSAEMEQTLRKKFGAAQARDFRERAKRARFLEYRGYPAHLIRQRLFADE